MTTNVQSLLEKMLQNQADIDKLKNDLARCESIASATISQDGDISALKSRRSAEVANALIDQRQADTAAIDAEIQKLQKASTKALADREAAAGGIPILKNRIAAAAAQLATTRSDLEDAVTHKIVEQHDQALEAYFAAVESLSDAVEAIVASEKTWRHVFKVGSDANFPGRGMSILKDIRSSGLRVRWDHSMLRDPQVAAGYLPGFENIYFVPWWADERNTQFAESLAAENIRDLQAAGYPIADYPTVGGKAADSKKPRSLTFVEVIRGTVEDSIHQINSATGRNVLVKKISYRPGQRFATTESEAADLVVKGSAKYVDGRSKEDAYKFLHPGRVMPAHILNPFSTGPALPNDDAPRANVQYEGQSGAESRAINGLPPSDVKINYA